MRVRRTSGPLIWTSGRIEQIAGKDTPTSMYAIEKRVQRKAVNVAGATGWGQFVDDRNWTDGQWGLLGISGAVQVLGRQARIAGQAVPAEVLAAAPLLPTDSTQLDPRLQAKADKGDFDNIYRLAIVAEALVPERDDVPAGHEPPLVAHIESLATNGNSWHPRSAIPAAPAGQGDAVTTAFVLHALRRYEDPRGRFTAHREWLAEQVLGDRRLWRRPDYLALIGLALLEGLRSPRTEHRLDEALTKCREELLGWIDRERGLVVDRPIFHPYNLGTTTDYLILNPEVMTALFFARHAAPPARSRRFILDVSRAVADNVAANDGFEGQIGAMTTMDQEWAMRLLTQLRSVWDDSGRRRMLRPSILASRQVVLGLLAGILLLGLAIVALFAKQDAYVVGALFVLGALVNVVTVLWGESRQRP